MWIGMQFRPIYKADQIPILTRPDYHFNRKRVKTTFFFSCLEVTWSRLNTSEVKKKPFEVNTKSRTSCEKLISLLSARWNADSIFAWIHLLSEFSPHEIISFSRTCAIFSFGIPPLTRQLLTWKRSLSRRPLSNILMALTSDLTSPLYIELFIILLNALRSALGTGGAI